MNPSLKKVLIVDDEPAVRESLRLLLKSNFDVGTAENGEEALTRIDNFHPDIVLMDVLMPRLDGLETLKRLHNRDSKVPVIMLTASNTVKTAVEAMKWGAIDYLNKPFDVEELTTLIVNTLEGKIKSRSKPEVSGGKSTHTQCPPGDFGNLVGSSDAMEAVFQKVRQVAGKDATVLITGESGTGKELIARRVHELSARKDGPFVPINCAAIPETLIESELFGHEKGAFTSAVDRRIGHFELANGGTLFLDEIGELSLPVQVKMLRFLQEQELYRVGSSTPIHVDVRIIAATNKDLEDLISQNLFRQDLYYRINVINLKLPPLRDRFEDIPNLCHHFVKKLAPQYEDRVLEFDRSAIDVLVQYDWPGNVRELENVVESLVALCLNDKVTDEDLPPKLKNPVRVVSERAAIFDGSMSFEEAEKRFETEMIIKALKKTNFVQTRAAELLGISRRILKYKMDKLGITDSLKDDPESGYVPAEGGSGDVGPEMLEDS